MGKVYLAVGDDARTSRSRCFPRARHSRKRTLCGAFAARWISPSAVLIPTSPARSRSATTATSTSWSWSTSRARACTSSSKASATARCECPTPPGCSSSSLDGLEAAHRCRPGPSRYQAVEHHDHPRRRREAARHGAGACARRRDRADPRQHRPGHARLRQPRTASRRRQGRRAERPVQRRLHPLFRPGGPGPFRGGRHDQQDLQAAHGRPRAARKRGPGVFPRPSPRSFAS